MSDEDLIRKFQKAGDQAALETLLARHQARIYNFLCKYLDHESDAADRTQDVFIRILRELPSLRDPGAFVPWLYRIALNEARQARRRRGRTQVEERTRFLPAAEPPAVPSETVEVLRAALSSLPDLYREPILLRFYDDLDYRQIANALQCPEGTIARRLHEGIERLRKTLSLAVPGLLVASVEALLAGEARAAVPVALKGRLGELLKTGARLPHGRVVTAGSPELLSGLGGTAKAFRASLGVAGGAGVLLTLLLLCKTNPIGPASEPPGSLPLVSRKPDESGRKDPDPDFRDLPAKSPASSGDIRSGQESVIRGVVWDQSRRTVIVGATVHLYEFPDTRRLGPEDPETLARFAERVDPDNETGYRPSATATTGSDGSYCFEQLATGRYCVGATAPGYFPEFMEPRRLNALHDVNPEPGETLEQAIQRTREARFEMMFLDPSTKVSKDLEILATRQLSGTVRGPGGQPIPHARVKIESHWLPVDIQPGKIAYRSVSSGSKNEALTDSSGRYLLDGLSPGGSLRILVEADEYWTELVTYHLDNAAGMGPLDVILSPINANRTAWFVCEGPPAIPSDELTEWTHKLMKPGYRLIYSTTLKSHDCSVFDAGPKELTVFVRDSDLRGLAHFTVSDEQGGPVYEADPSAPFDRGQRDLGVPDLLRGRIYPPGIAYTLRPNFSGKVKITFLETPMEEGGGFSSKNDVRLGELVISR